MALRAAAKREKEGGAALWEAVTARDYYQHQSQRCSVDFNAYVLGSVNQTVEASKAQRQIVNLRKQNLVLQEAVAKSISDCEVLRQRNSELEDLLSNNDKRNQCPNPHPTPPALGHVDAGPPEGAAERWAAYFEKACAVVSKH